MNEEEPFMLPIDAAERKKFPIYTGCVAYFKDAIACVARRSWEGNNQHHPDKPLHWDKSKSYDELDADMRHKMEMEPDAAAWRALAHLQRQLEAGWRPSWYNPEHYVHHESLGIYQIDEDTGDMGSDASEETEEPAEDTEVLCGTTGIDWGEWEQDGRSVGFRIYHSGLEKHMRKEGYYFQDSGLWFWDDDEAGGVEELRSVFTEYLAQAKSLVDMARGIDSNQGVWPVIIDGVCYSRIADDTRTDANTCRYTNEYEQ